MATSPADPVDIAFDAGALLGECPVWSAGEEVLYWVDIDARLIHRFDPATGTDDARPTPGRPGSIALTEQPGRLLVASEHQVGWFDWDAPGFEPWVDLEPAGTGNRLNDGRTDRAGRFWVGSMHEHPAARRFTGMLHRVDPDGATAVDREDVGVPNSLAFSPDGTTMYWADTLAGAVLAHDYDLATGTPGPPRVFADFTTLTGNPDGACVDEDGCLWVACVWGGSLARFTPAGDLDRLVPLPVEAPTMPAFGGPGLRTLFVTSIGRAAQTASATPASPHAGALLAVDAGVGGLPEPPFGA